MALLDDLPKELRRLAEQMKYTSRHTLPRLAGTETLRFIAENFVRQGYQGKTFQRWRPRKTTNAKGRDLLRYRTDRVGRRGRLTQLGRRDKGRGLLVGHNSGSNALKASFLYKIAGGHVHILNHKRYAAYHNEGSNPLPRRRFVGESPILLARVQKKIESTLQRLLP